VIMARSTSAAPIDAHAAVPADGASCDENETVLIVNTDIRRLSSDEELLAVPGPPPPPTDASAEYVIRSVERLI